MIFVLIIGSLYWSSYQQRDGVQQCTRGMERRWWCTLYILTPYLIFVTSTTSSAGVKIFRLVSKTYAWPWYCQVPGQFVTAGNLTQRPFFIWILSSSMIIILFLVLLPPPTWQRRESVSLRSKRWAAWRCLEHTGRSPSRAPGWQSHTQLV